jgi:hypothetical protein
MVNINKLRIFIIESPNIQHLDSLGVFDHYEIGWHLFVGLAVDSPRLREELDGIYDYSSTPLIDFHEIRKLYQNELSPVLEYSGIKYTIDGILDIMLDEQLDDNRRLYLESVLYFKSNQKGKSLNNLNLNIKHFDDFCHQFSEDIVSHEILFNNEDFSESRVIIETYLTEEEAKRKFSNFLIK